MHHHSNRRRTVLPQPRLQILCALSLCASALAALIFQAILVHFTIRQTSSAHPEIAGRWLGEIYGDLWKTLGIATLLFLPAMFFLGTMVTFRLAGPIYRIESYLRAVRDGEEHGPCHIRKDDEFQELCKLVNEVTEPVRAARAETSAPLVPDPVQHLESPLPASRQGTGVA